MFVVAVPAMGRTYPPLFGTAERMFPDTGVYPKWSDMLQRLGHFEDMHVSPCRRERGISFCEVEKWKEFIKTQDGHGTMDILDAVNNYMNRYPYVLDIVNYGIEDYWAAPQEHVTMGGDCEDYAIAKFITLRKLGFASIDMRVVVLNDLNLKAQHAILVVYVGNTAYVLDNQTSRILPSTRIFHYQPIYSITTGIWWLHTITSQQNLTAPIRR